MEECATVTVRLGLGNVYPDRFDISPSIRGGIYDQPWVAPRLGCGDICMLMQMSCRRTRTGTTFHQHCWSRTEYTVTIWPLFITAAYLHHVDVSLQVS